MPFIAVVVLLGAMISNHGDGWVSGIIGFSPKATLIMLQGSWIAVLSIILLLFAWMLKASIWRNLTIAGLVVSTVEAVQIPVCRSRISDIRDVPANVTLCDYVSGWSISSFLILCEVLSILVVLAFGLVDRRAT